MTLPRAHAPWTAAQVASLNGYQQAGHVHPFTSAAGVVLVATPAGWVDREGGPVVQTWAHAFMADESWRKTSWVDEALKTIGT
jgi:hypothetical protein